VVEALNVTWSQKCAVVNPGLVISTSAKLEVVDPVREPPFDGCAPPVDGCLCAGGRLARHADDATAQNQGKDACEEGEPNQSGLFRCDFGGRGA
jgi:hypothetical protein